MKTNIPSRILLFIAFAATAATCPADAAPPDVPTVPASSSWGAGLNLGDPVGVLFTPAAYAPNWKFRGASGGARLENETAGSRGFTIDMSGFSGENIAAGTLRFDGRATFAGTDDGALAVDWQVVPDHDANLPEVMVEARIPLGRVAGGFRVDGEAVPIPDAVPRQPHLFRGAVSRVETLGADGEPWLQIDLPDTAQILVQDNRAWGGTVATLRLFFAQKSVEAGKTYPLRVRFSVPGRAIRMDASGPVALKAGPDWIPVEPPTPGEDWIEPGSALDFSATIPHHEPAGAFGRVVVVGDHFEFEDRPGEKIRFCGVNIVHGANIPATPDHAERFAANLARMGFNTVRIHHHERVIFKRGDPAALEILPDALDRFDALCAACIRHGLYITTDLFVSREPIAWRALGIDRDGTLKKDQFKRLVVFHEGSYSNLVAWTRFFLTHVNPYTGRSLAEEPGLATLAIVNEGNLGNWGRDALLATPGVKEAWRDWCAARGIEPADLSALPADLYEGKADNKALSETFALFLADSEERFYRRMAALVRDELGCRAPLSSLSSWYNPASYSLVRSVFDYDDDHGYVDHPFFLGKAWKLPSTHSGANPLHGSDAVPSYAWRRLFGKPFCVTEWNWAAPGEYRAASGLVMGALAARQGWDGMWRFAWSHNQEGVDAPGSIRMRYFDLHSDPTLCASERATLCLFLRGDLAPLPSDAMSPIEADEAALRRGEGAAKRIVTPPNKPSGWTHRIGVRLGAGSAPEPVPVPEMPHDMAKPEPSRGSFVVDTPCTAGGFAPAGAIEAGPLRFKILAGTGPDAQISPLGGGADVATAVWASSLDGKPLAESSRILLSHVTDSKNTNALFDDPACRIWLDHGTTPALMRRGIADISLALTTPATPADSATPANGTNPANGANDANDVNGVNGVNIFRLSSSGHRIAEIPATWDPATGRLSFTADTAYDPASATLYYEIVR